MNETTSWIFERTRIAYFVNEFWKKFEIINLIISMSSAKTLLLFF